MAAVSLRGLVQESTIPTASNMDIVGGEEAPPNKFPFFAALYDADGDDVCGASLIHPEVLLTAGHCIMDGDDFEVGNGVYIGIEDLENPTENGGLGAVYREMVQNLIHPNFVDYPSMTAYDFGLLKLNEPVTTITPVELNWNDTIPVSMDIVTLMGFGALEEDGDAPNKLHEVNVTAVSHTICRALYTDTGFYELDDPIDEKSMFCAGNLLENGRDSCNGDSGGPVVTPPGSDGSPMKQVGIVSFGQGCARELFPGINARVSGAKDFIEQGICTFSSDEYKPSYCSN